MEGEPGYDPLADMDCNGAVDALDFATLQDRLRRRPGAVGAASRSTLPACP